MVADIASTGTLYGLRYAIAAVPKDDSPLAALCGSSQITIASLGRRHENSAGRTGLALLLMQMVFFTVAHDEFPLTRAFGVITSSKQERKFIASAVRHHDITVAEGTIASARLPNLAVAASPIIVLPAPVWHPLINMLYSDNEATVWSIIGNCHSNGVMVTTWIRTYEFWSRMETQ